WEGSRTDFDQDGDEDDDVLQVYEVDTDDRRNMAFASDRIWGVDGPLLAFSVSESAQGNSDLNDDGDSNGHALGSFDMDSLSENLFSDDCIRANVGGGLILMSFERLGTLVYDPLTGAVFAL